jgi:hypothetical protein
MPHLDGVPRTRSSPSSPTPSPGERAAVVLRYGYATSTTTIAAALDSKRGGSQAASSGVRASEGGSHDRSHRPIPLPTPPARAGLFDAAYDVIDSELGPLLAAVTTMGSPLYLLRPGAEQSLRRSRGSRAGAAASAPRARRDGGSSTTTSSPPHRIRPRVDLRGYPTSRSRCSGSSPAPTADRELRRALASAPEPSASRAVGSVMNRNRIPIVLPATGSSAPPASWSAMAAASTARSVPPARRRDALALREADPQERSPPQDPRVRRGQIPEPLLRGPNSP